MSDAVFVIDDNAVIRVYPSRMPGLSGNARRAVIAALLPSLQALAEHLGRVTGARWTVVDAEAQDEVPGETITDEQIEQLRAQAARDREISLVNVCRRALDRSLGSATTRREAHDICAAAYKARFGGLS